MNTTTTIAVIGAIAVVGVLGYQLGQRSHDGPPAATGTVQTGAVTPAQPAPAATADPHAGLPTGAGAVASAQPPLGHRFAQFKVGDSNVKALLADGPVVWVGTSGGVIRYDTEKDEHRLYDVRAGLLSNGIFHLSRLGDRLAVGTYGGGLSLFDEANDDWTNYNIQHGLGDGFVYDLLQLPNGDIWIGTREAVVRLGLEKSEEN